jgi:hypothetical protein
MQGWSMNSETAIRAHATRFLDKVSKQVNLATQELEVIAGGKEGGQNWDDSLADHPDIMACFKECLEKHDGAKMDRLSKKLENVSLFFDARIVEDSSP